MLERFALGAEVAFQPLSLLMMLLGVAWGILGGALPGISGSIAMALLLPLTFGMNPAVALPTTAMLPGRAPTIAPSASYP